jgi:carboxyl-terminal processing protease
MVESLGDPYSAYYTDEEYSDFSESYEGTAVGVGMHIAPVSRDLGYLKVVSVFGGGPAEMAGVLNDDLVVAVDGIDLRNLDFESAKNLINGPSGSEVTLTIATDNVSRDAVMKRAEVQTPYVFYSTLDDRIGEIIISDFNGNCVEEFSDSLDALIEEEEVEGIVIDVRDNFGSNVKNAVDILDMIMPGDSMLGFSVDKNGDRSDMTAKGEYNDIPISVIVNGGTGYASEIFTAALQDNGRAHVVGTQTFGKGVAQTIVEMPYSGGG